RPLHARLRIDPSSTLTVDAQVAASRIANGAVSATFRRVARRGGPVGRVLFAAGARSRIVERLNAPLGAADAVAAMTPRIPPAGVALLDAVSTLTKEVSLSPLVISRASGWVVTRTVLAQGDASLTADTASTATSTSTSTSAATPPTGGSTGPSPI